MNTRVQQCIAGAWVDGAGEGRLSVLDPATGEVREAYAAAVAADVDRAVESAVAGFQVWSATPAWTRGMLLLKVADVLRSRRQRIARRITAEQGKPLDESLAEVERAADFFSWAGGEAPRQTDRLIPSREGSEIVAGAVPIGPVCAFTPWNYPLILLAKKLGAALAAGCSVVIKPSEETPGAAVELVQACQDAGIPADVINLVLGDPSAISRQLIDDPRIRKVSFTGSIEVGRLLASQAGRALKPITLELGGHAPVIICDDVAVEPLAARLAERKFHNAGQACIAPSRFLVHERLFDGFVDAFTAHARRLRVGPGASPGVQMGPLANRRRLAAMQAMIDDARQHGGDVVSGGAPVEGAGFFFEPTIVVHPAETSQLMTLEPFGPVAAMVPFTDLHDALSRANGLQYGLAAYAFTEDAARQALFASRLEAGLVGVNSLPGHLPEYPLGGWKESGLGVEGGAEAVESYQVRRLVSRRPTAA